MSCYYQCDAFVLPSFSEGFPMVVLEAWAYGKPVLMTPECNLPEGFESNAAIRIATDVENIERGLRQLFEMSAADCQAMGEHGKKLVIEKYSWPRIAARHEGSLRLGARGRGQARVCEPRPGELIRDSLRETLIVNSNDYKDFGFKSVQQGHMHARFMPHVLALSGPLGANVRVLDVGCGNGFTCGEFLKRGCKVVGIDLSREGIEIARLAHPTGRFELLPADDKLLANLREEPFDLVISTEVVEHLYAPREYARGCFNALKPGGRFICTTPYHGYLKNLALSLVGRWDAHANPLWDGGHIKLWSRHTLAALLREAGFENLQFRGV